jgi:hypothetical protein
VEGNITLLAANVLRETVISAWERLAPSGAAILISLTWQIFTLFATAAAMEVATAVDWIFLDSFKITSSSLPGEPRQAYSK